MNTRQLTLRIISGVFTLFLLLNFMACSEDEAKKPATVETGEISALTKNSVTITGNVTNDGQADVTDRGVVWSTTAQPTTASNKTSAGTGEGEFEAAISGLSPNTFYYARAFAVNSVGTSYGEEITFTTNDLAQVTTGAISNLTTTSVTIEGNVTFDGNTSVTGRGIVLATTHNPTILDIMKPEGSGTGTFSSNLSGLTPNTLYYARAYATNSQGTSYGAEVEFTTYLNPTITTGSASDITSVTANLSATLGNTGNPAITEMGIVYGTDHNPTTSNNKSASGSTSVGSFNVTITQIDPSTTYYVRAYAISTLGTFYGSEISFTTSDINASLKAQYNFDMPFNTSFYKDATGNNADLTGGTELVSTPDRAGNAGKSAYFQGTANSIVNGSVDFGNSTSVTISIWFKPVSNSLYIIGGAGIQYYYLNIGGNVQTHFYLNGLGNASTGGISANNFLNTWHHFVGVYDGTTVKHYFDGQLASSNPWNNTVNGGQFGSVNFSLGAYGATYYEGYMDNLMMFGRALSAEEVKYLYNH